MEENEIYDAKEMNNSNEFSDENNEFNFNNLEYIQQNQKSIEKIMFNVHFYFKINDEEYLFRIESSPLNENQYVYELIINIVNIFNSVNKEINLNNKKYYIYLKKIDDDVNEDNLYKYNYILKPAKKNFKPKNDMPNYSFHSFLKDIKDERLSFVCNNKENILLKEILDDVEFDNLNDSNQGKIRPKIQITNKNISKDDNKSQSNCILY